MHYNDDILDDYLSGELGPERDATIHAHLESCTDCSARYDAAAGARDWLRAAAHAEEREFPSLIRARVWEAVGDLQPTLLERVRAFWRPMIAVPIAAALAAFFYVGVPIVHNANTPAGVAASYLLEEHAAVASENPLADRGLIVNASTIDSESPSNQ